MSYNDAATDAVLDSLLDGDDPTAVAFEPELGGLAQLVETLRAPAHPSELAPEGDAIRGFRQWSVAAVARRRTRRRRWMVVGGTTLSLVVATSVAAEDRLPPPVRFAIDVVRGGATALRHLLIVDDAAVPRPSATARDALNVTVGMSAVRAASRVPAVPSSRQLHLPEPHALAPTTSVVAVVPPASPPSSSPTETEASQTTTETSAPPAAPDAPETPPIPPPVSGEQRRTVAPPPTAQGQSDERAVARPGHRGGPLAGQQTGPPDAKPNGPPPDTPGHADAPRAGPPAPGDQGQGGAGHADDGQPHEHVPPAAGKPPSPDSP
jgi:hypothetical protein